MLRTTSMTAVALLAMSSVTFAGSQVINIGGSRQIAVRPDSHLDRAPYALTGETVRPDRDNDRFEVVRLATRSFAVRHVDNDRGNDR